MNTQEDVRGFLAEKTLAIAGISRDEKAFSSMVHKDLLSKGFKVLLVNPNASEIRGEKCYPNLKALPQKVGAESDAVIQFCRDKGLAAITGQCLLMFAEPVGFHGVHRWFKKLFGGTPK